MTKSIIQFHAAPNELAHFVAEIAKALKLQVVLLRFRPSFSAELLSNPDELAEKMDQKGGNQVALLKGEPLLSASGQLQFYDSNPALILFDFARWLPEGLRQSSMGYKTDDQELLAAGKEIAKRLKKITKSGVLIFNPETGDRGVQKSFRYTEGALALEKAGVQMLPMGGNLAKLGHDAT